MENVHMIWLMASLLWFIIVINILNASLLKADFVYLKKPLKNSMKGDHWIIKLLNYFEIFNSVKWHFCLWNNSNGLMIFTYLPIVNYINKFVKFKLAFLIYHFHYTVLLDLILRIWCNLYSYVSSPNGILKIKDIYY